MAAIRLSEIAFARSGDKGNASNVGVVARQPEFYPVLEKYLTVGLVKAHFQGICRGPVDRYALPNLNALNFILHDSLGGGGSESLRTDAQGKSHALMMLELVMEVAEEDLPAGWNPA